jgi:periplasmic protein TonB
MLAAQPFQPPRNKFPLMLIVSLLCHALISLLLMQPQRGGNAFPSVPVFDLNLAASETASLPSATKILPQPATKAPEEPLPPTAPRKAGAQSEQQPLPGTANTSTAPDELHRSGIGLGLTNGYFSGLGEGETLRQDIREYYFSMLRRVNEKWWLQGASRQGSTGSAVISLIIARDGTVVQSVLVNGSGNPAFDRAILQAVMAASPLPPLPDTYRGDFFNAPLRFRAPLSLMSP